MTFRQRDMHDIVLHIVETAAQARCAIHLCTYCRKIKPLLTRTTYRKEEQVCRGADMRGGGTGARRREVFCGSGALGRPRLLPYPAYLPSARAPPTKEGTSDRQEAGRESSLVQDRLHGALSTARLIPPLLLPWFRTLVVAFAHDYYYRRRIAILMGTKQRVTLAHARTTC